MKHSDQYVTLLIMTVLSFISMYILMYSMVDRFAHVYSNINQLYMAGLMTIPMVLIELLLMRSMYGNKTLNTVIRILSVALFFALLFFIRRQVGVDDREFLRSMIPHHAAAVLMCEKTSLKDPGLKKLCKNIISTQQAEIDFMKTKLATFATKE